MADTIRPERLAGLVTDILQNAGAQADIAAEVAENLVEADLLGRHSHGARLAASYVDRLRRGIIDGSARPQVVSRKGAIAKVDGRQAFGQITGKFAAELGCTMALDAGMAVVATTNSAQFGRNGKWPEIAARAGIVSMHFVNSPGTVAAVVPFGARDSRLGTNPIAFGVPRRNNEPLVVDFSVGDLAGNFVRLAHERGDKLPRASIMRPDGTLSDDPADFVAAGMRGIVAFGGYKGTALALFAEIFAGALSGGGCLTGDGGKSRTNNMLSVFIDPTAFVSRESFDADVDGLLGWILSAPPAAGHTLRLPGDRSAAIREKQSADGITFDGSLRSLLGKLTDELDGSGALRARWPELA